MLFSFIVPVYNVALYLPACIDSMLAQKNRDFEILLIDDGSTDGESGQICDRYALQFPQKIRVVHQENAGQGAARNVGISMARGEYLFFVDSDDYIHGDALEILAHHIEQTHADIYQFGFYYVQEGNLLPGDDPKLPTLQVLTLAEHKSLVLETPSPCFRVCRRSLFLDNRILFPSKVWYEDLRTIPKLHCHAATEIILPDRLYYYILRSGSTMHNSNAPRNLEILAAIEDLQSYFQEQSLLPQLADEMCCLAVDNVLFAAQRVLMMDRKASFLPRFMEYLEKTYPHYSSNPLLGRMGRKKLLFLRLFAKKRYNLLYIIFRVKQLF